MTKFWRWATNATAAQVPVRTLYLEGYIAEESWLGDEITPAQFKQDLYAGMSDVPDDIIVSIASPGGDVFAAAKIYDLLMDYPGKKTVHIHALAASAASVIAMVGNPVLMSPTAVIMCHNPATIAMGEVGDFEAAISLLQETKEAIINAYSRKTSLPRSRLARMMDCETWMSANKAIELGFADGILYNEDTEPTPENGAGFLYDRLTVTNALLNKLPRRAKPAKDEDPSVIAEIKVPHDIPIEQLSKRLSLLKH